MYYRVYDLVHPILRSHNLNLYFHVKSKYWKIEKSKKSKKQEYSNKKKQKYQIKSGKLYSSLNSMLGCGFLNSKVQTYFGNFNQKEKFRNFYIFKPLFFGYNF